MGRYNSIETADNFATQIVALDVIETKQRGQDYMPVIFPGFSYNNASKGKEKLDRIPRLCGEFYYAQASNLLKIGVTTIYTAMFDEINEGTSIFKVVRQVSKLPAGLSVLAPDAQANCPNGVDLYLEKAREVSMHLHEIR